MKKNFLLLLWMTLLPLAGWAANYTVKIGAKAANIQFGVETPTTATQDMFMVLDWNGCDDSDSRNFILGEIASNLSVTSERKADSPLGNYAFTLSVTAPGYQQIAATENYYRVVVEDGSSSGTFKQVKNAGKPNLTLGVRATSLTYTGEELSLLSTLPDAYFGADYAEALVKGLPVEFQVVKGGEVVSGWSTNEPKATAAGTYDVKYRVMADTRYTADEDATILDGIQIAKATPVITTLPTFAESTTFVAGTPVNLIKNPGEATLGASMRFRYQKDGSAWSTWYSPENSRFTRNDAATFKIQYSTAETSNLNASALSEPVEIVIAKADITPEQFTAPTAAALTYNGEDQALVEGAATTGIAGTFTYATSEDGETWNDFAADVPTGKNAKKYFVKYKFTPTANYNAYEAVVENVAIAPLSIVDGEGNLAANFALSPADMTNANASVYTGTAFTPTVALRYKGKSMSHSVLEGGDYARSYNNNINASNEAEIIFTAKNNFTGAYTQKFTINKANIENLNVTLAQTEYTYSAAANEPGVTVKLGEYTFAAEDYAVEYTNNTNAGTATVTVTPNVENFTAASKSVNFTINKAALTVKVADAEKTYGSVDPTPAVESIEGFVGEETKAVLPDGAYSINRADGADPGTYAYTVVDNGVVGCNYSFADAAPQGALTIKAATVIVRATAVNGTYGYHVPALDESGFEFTAEGLKAGHIINALTFTVTNEQGEEQAFDTMLPAGTYTITPSNAVTDAGSYTFDYQTATLTIAKKDLTLTAQNQTIEYGNSANTEVVFDGEHPTVVVVGRLYDDELGTITINVAAEATSIGTHEDAITLSVENENANYNYTLVAGNLNITAPVAGITLTGAASDAQTISDYAGQEVNVTIDFSSRNGRNLGTERNWVKENWVTMTLPFNITVAELSQKLGYAIVNVIDPSKTVINGTSSEFYGKLTMKGGNGSEDYLVANKPFLVKIADNIEDLNNGLIDFGQQTIVAPEDLSVDAGQGAKFVGTYATKTVTKDDNANIWFMLGNTAKWAYIGTSSVNSWNIVPFEAYIDMSELPAGAPRNMTFVFEEIDGSTTAITSIEAGNLNSKLGADGWYTLNGVKLQNAPAQKGVYIKDGKKVVIK